MVLSLLNDLSPVDIATMSDVAVDAAHAYTATDLDSGSVATVYHDTFDITMDDDSLWDTPDRVPFCTDCNQYDHTAATCPNSRVKESRDDE